MGCIQGTFAAVAVEIVLDIGAEVAVLRTTPVPGEVAACTVAEQSYYPARTGPMVVRKTTVRCRVGCRRIPWAEEVELRRLVEVGRRTEMERQAQHQKGWEAEPELQKDCIRQSWESDREAAAAEPQAVEQMHPNESCQTSR